MEKVDSKKRLAYTGAKTSSKKRESVAKKKEGEVSISYDVPTETHDLLETTFHELKLAGDRELTKKSLIAEVLAEGLPRVKQRRLRDLKKPIKT